MSARTRQPVALVLVVLFAAIATVSWPAVGSAATRSATGTTGTFAAQAPVDLCSTEEWQADFRRCVSKLQDVGQARAQCLTPPTPTAPDSGLAGWFAERPASAAQPGPRGLYSDYGYAGYSYTTYDIGCAAGLINPEYKFTTTVANGEFMLATAIVGASNALRERAWNPGSMWGWADPLVERATRAIYDEVFTVFGVITLCVVGLYLLWRSRQSDMNNAMTTAGWALLVMVVVTALAAWPVRSANLADQGLVGALGVVHDAVGPGAKSVPADKCVMPNPEACIDKRPPAVRAGDTVTETLLYRNWLRGMLGSADSETAKKYGRALYDARSLSWEEAQKLRENPGTREATIAAKQRQWMKIAEQIKAEDPEAYEYLQGTRDMDRIGAGFIALLAAVLFAMFDLTASFLVLLGFLVFRWAVVAAPIVGTVGLLRPASAGLRRLGNAVVAALFNIAIFGTGGAIYLFAVDLVMSTPTLPGWLQVVLVWLCGVVLWLLLRPYRRITQLGGKDPSAAVTSAGSWHRRFFHDVREAAKLNVVESGGTAEPRIKRDAPGERVGVRPEARAEEPVTLATSQTPTATQSARPRERVSTWSEPDIPEPAPSYAIYRPDAAPETATLDREARAEAR
ncbi:MAG TPA: MFS transporter [Micromonosporaceae bacterium]